MPDTIVGWRVREERELMFYGDYVRRFSHERMNEPCPISSEAREREREREGERENVGCAAARG